MVRGGWGRGDLGPSVGLSGGGALGILFTILTPVPHRKSPDKMEDSQLNLNFRVLGSRTPFCIKKRENITNNFQYIAWDNECPVFLFAKPGKPASISTMGTPVSPRLPGSGLGPSSGGLVTLLLTRLGRPWDELAVSVPTDTASGCGEQRGWVCVEWGRGNWAVAEPETRELFSVGSCLIPSPDSPPPRA